MTTPSTERKAGPLLGTGAQTTWPFTFKVFAVTDIAVTIADSLGVETALTYGVHYTVTLNANQETSPGGTVTYPISGSPLPTGSRLVIVGNLPYDQPLDLPAGGNFSPLALENELDRLTMQIQQLRERVGRALQVSVTTGANVGLPAPSANELIGWDSTGQNLQNFGLTELATAVAYATMRYDTFTGDGVETQFTLTADPVTLANLDVAISGVTQVPGSDYSLVSGVLVFTSAPPNGAEILARYGEGLVNVGGDSSDIRFLQAGTGAVDRTVQAKLRDVVSVLDFGADRTGATNARAAIQAAVSSGAAAIYFPTGTYLIQASTGVGVTLPASVVLFGDGMDATVIKSVPTTLSDSEEYSNNLFTTSPGLDKVVFRDMTFDGAGTGPGVGDGHEYALVLTYNVNRLTFENVRVTQYSSDWDGTSKSVYNRRFQAITVRNNANTEYTRFINLQLRDNHYEQVDVYYPHTSEAWTIIDGCSEINTAAIPDSHTAFMVTGGHLTLTNSFFKNTKFSTININNTKSVLVDSNHFIDQYQIPLSQVVNVGHSLWYGCDNVVITNNHFENCDSSAISHAGGSGIVIANNVIIDGGLNPIKLRAELRDDGSPSGFSVAFPDYPLPTIGISYDVKIVNNVIAGATYTSGVSSRAVWLSYIDPSDGYWYNVDISGNTISMLDAPDDTHYPIWADQVEEVNIVDNYFNYKFTAIYSAGKSDNVRIVGNTFGGNVSTQSSDIVFTGGGGTITSKELRIENNRFIAIPRETATNITVAFGRSFDGIFILNNINTKTEGLISTTSPYYVSNTLPGMVTTTPTTGIYRLFDRVATVPAAGRPPEYVCSAPGCFATFTATASGTAGQYTLTVTDGTQFLPGQRISVNGVGSGGTNRYFVVCDVVGNTLHVDRTVLTTAAGQAVTAVNPTFVKTANYS